MLSGFSDLAWRRSVGHVRGDNFAGPNKLFRVGYHIEVSNPRILQGTFVINTVFAVQGYVGRRIIRSTKSAFENSFGTEKRTTTK
jgi:hypothetical protein